MPIDFQPGEPSHNGECVAGTCLSWSLKGSHTMTQIFDELSPTRRSLSELLTHAVFRAIDKLDSSGVSPPLGDQPW